MEDHNQERSNSMLSWSDKVNAEREWKAGGGGGGGHLHLSTLPAPVVDNGFIQVDEQGKDHVNTGSGWVDG